MSLIRFLHDFREERHRFPELSGEEFATTAAIKKVLLEKEITVLDLPLKTGLVAEIKNGAGGIVALRGDIDALPIQEESGVEYTSQNAGVMHACGHDVHMTAVLGAALLLKQNQDKLKGTVRLVFQPAEEIGKGALEVLQTTALDNVSAIFGIHNDPALPIGTIGTKPDALTAAVDRFDIKITAVGTHAAHPQEGNDPIIVLGQLINAVQSIVSRNVASADNAVVSITQVHSGATWNVIPEGAFVEGTVRTFSTSVRLRIKKRLKEITSGLAATFGVKIDFVWHAGAPSVMNTPELIDLVMETAHASNLKTQIVEPNPIGEDFAFYQLRMKGVFIMVGSSGEYALHHPKFKIKNDLIYPTAKYLAQLAINYLNKD